jgi:hypothetical protein
MGGMIWGKGNVRMREREGGLMRKGLGEKDRDALPYFPPFSHEFHLTYFLGI